VGLLCGIVGATLFACNFILSARIGWIEEVLQGLPKVYNLHHLLGGVAFILLLVHPVFLGLQYLPSSVEAAAAFFWPNVNDIPKLLGMTALSVLSVLLFITFFIRIAYHNWKSTHQWLGLALLLASLHVYLIPGHLDASPWLRGYMVFLMIAGLIAFSYRVLFGRWLVHRYPFVVDAVTLHNSLATEVQLVPQAQPVSYQAGQFFFLRVYSSSRITREAHPFSFTSSPTQKAISLAAKNAGDYTSTLPQLKKGIKVDIEGPYGRFLLNKGGSNQIWIAGGIGITPFMSRARQLTLDYKGEIQLYYVIKNKDQALFVKELRDIASKIPGFRLQVWESEQLGKFKVEAMDAFDQLETRFFICGPTGMMADLKQQLKTKNIPRHHIFTEEFKLY
jgi:predicted ferric reductase